MRGVKIYWVLIRLMNQNFSKVKFHTNHLNWSIFNGGKNFGGTNLEGVKILDLSEVLVFNSCHI